MAGGYSGNNPIHSPIDALSYVPNTTTTFNASSFGSSGFTSQILGSGIATSSFNTGSFNTGFTGPVSTPTLASLSVPRINSFDTSISNLGTSFNTVNNFGSNNRGLSLSSIPAQSSTFQAKPGFFEQAAVFVAGGFSGLKTSGKALFNAGADTVAGFATLGFKESPIRFTPTQTDINNSFGASNFAFRGALEVGSGLLTGGASQLGRIGKAVNAIDAAGNLVSAGRGAADIANNGVTLQNSVQLLGGGLGVGSNVATGGRALAELASDASRVRVDSFGINGGLPIPKRIYLAPTDISGAGSYRIVRGHHVLAKKGFEGASGYDFREAFSLSDDLLGSYGVRHVSITPVQQRLFTKLAKSSRPNNLTQHTRIAYQSLVEVGIPKADALRFTSESVRQVIRAGVVEPTRLPWSP